MPTVLGSAPWFLVILLTAAGGLLLGQDSAPGIIEGVDVEGVNDEALRTAAPAQGR